MEALLTQIAQLIRSPNLKSKNDCEDFKRLVLGKNGLIQSAMNEFRALSGSEKPKWGSELNRLKAEATDLYQSAIDQLDSEVVLPWSDITLPLS